MTPLPEDLELAYGPLYRLAVEALGHVELGDLPRAVRAFRLTPHELAVLRALEWLLAGRDDLFEPQRLAPGPAAGLTVPAGDTLSSYRRQAAEGANVLRWSLLLHDLAKQRGMAGPHPENCARVAERILARAGGLSAEERSLIVWLVRYHDVLGNIYCGERAPRFLLEMSRGLDAAEIVRRLRLLQVVMLCDLRGTWDGALLTDAKARFWLELAEPEQILRRQADLFAWRLERWSGSLLGAANPDAEFALREALLSGSDIAARRRLETAFGVRVSYIVYGFYLFTAIDPRQLAALMRLIALAVDGVMADQVHLVFETIYRPSELLTTKSKRTAAGRALGHYTEQLHRNRLALRVESEDTGPNSATIHVE